MENTSLRDAQALVLLSGGQDSTTCLYWAKANFGHVRAIGFAYGQRHAVELRHAQRIAGAALVPFEIIPAEGIQFLCKNALTNPQVALSPELNPASGLPNTFVPGRNLLFLSMAGARAYCLEISHLVGGMCQTDYAGYPDCRLSFVESAQATLRLALGRPLCIHTPLMHLTKAQTWLLAKDLGCLDVVVQESHTCYNGNRTDFHVWGHGCGLCLACTTRAKGYFEAFGDGESRSL